jgi:hypothetical protein
MFQNDKFFHSQTKMTKYYFPKHYKVRNDRQKIHLSSEFQTLLFITFDCITI